VPNPQTVYQDKDRALLYVRTEDRGDGPEHLFITTRNRVVLQVWLTEVPREAELVIDTDGRRQAQESLWLLEAAEHEKGILVRCLRRACEWLPAECVKELQAMWRTAQP
jgi:hypothetical protein